MKILEPSVPFIDLTFHVLDSESQNEAGFFLFCQGNLLLRQEKPYALKHQDLPAGIDLNAALYVGTLENRPYYAIALSDSKLGMDAVGLRSLMDSDQPFFQLMARAYHLIHWDSTHRFCGRCGTRTCLSRTELVRQCPACDFRVYPRLSPCVIMLVHRGDDILLAQRPGGSTLYAVQAGFIEAGESLLWQSALAFPGSAYAGLFCRE